jgi:hypothetical protein
LAWAKKSFSTELLDELDKTVLLCVEHHKVLTAQRIRGRVKLDLVLDKLRLKKELTGQVIADFADKKLSFFSCFAPVESGRSRRSG